METHIKISSQAHGGVPFSLKAEKKGNAAEVRIIGPIGFETNSEDFRREIDALKADGVNHVHLYINSPGGFCFDAAEIVNILSGFKGNITGEGGALVASAATYIALHCKTFTMPENGLFMIHKPVLSVEGTEAEIESKLAMLRKIQAQYYDAYKALTRNAAEFDTKWNSGDYWMTAQEAKEAGFITGITKRIGIDNASASMIAACGYPVARLSGLQTQLIALLELRNDATDSDIIDAVKGVMGESESVQEAVNAGLIDGSQADNFAAMAKADPAAFRNFIANARKAQKERIEPILQAAVSVGKIIWQDLPIYRVIAEKTGLHDIQKLIDVLPDRDNPMDIINPKPRAEWGLMEYRKFAPEELRDNPALYARLMEREGRAPEPTTETLDYYRRHNPEYLEAHPDVYQRLINRKNQ